MMDLALKTRDCVLKMMDVAGVLKVRVDLQRGRKLNLHATHLEHSDQGKQATQVAEIASGIVRVFPCVFM